jgi:hypothetical protein
MATTQDWLSDTQATVLDGMSRGREPELISEQQAAMLRNISIRGGRARPRPRIVYKFPCATGLVQGASFFRARNTIVFVISGRLFELDPRDWTTVSERTSAGTLLSPTRPQVWMCETEGTMVVQDGQARPIFYDGVTCRRAGDDEVPVGQAMDYANGRLAVAVNNASAVRLGDIRQTAHQSELKFTETTFLNGGGDFNFASPVTALKSLPVIDTGSGHGALIVGCRDSVHTLKTQITQRDLWNEVGFGTVLLPNRGVVGPNALVAVNQDLYFRSSDGLRSLRTSTGDYDAPGLAPLSVEVRHRFDYDTPFLLDGTSMAYFDNRLLCTHSPFIRGTGTLAQGIIAFNFDAISGRGAKSPPAFDGEWDGFLISQIFTGVAHGVQRCFVIARYGAGFNGIFEVLRETEDQTGPRNSAAVASSYFDENPSHALETRTLFADSPGTLKNLRRCDVQFSDIRTALAVRVFYRPEKAAFWMPWDTFSVSALAPAAWGVRADPQRRTLLSTRTVPEVYDPVTGRAVSCGTGFQIRVEWDGFARLDYVQLFQERLTMPSYAENPGPGDTGNPEGAVFTEFWHSQPVSPLAGLD